MKHAVIFIAIILGLSLAGSASAQASGSHWCRHGDPPILASARTSCPLAGNIINAYVNVCNESRVCRARVYSPVTHRRYSITCRSTGSHIYGTVRCQGAASTGISTRFSSDI
jgi:hypothetical protein